MTQKDAITLYDIVKSDNLTSFCAQYEKDKSILNVAFGRFPLLSVCYLYNSKKIIKKFGKKLSKIIRFEVLSEPFVLYQDFKHKAQRNIKYYAGTEDIVFPIEMLAILHKDNLVKKQFKIVPKAENSFSKLEKIYANNRQKCSKKGKKLHISAKKLTKTQKKVIIFANAISFSALLIGLSLFAIIASVFGLGTLSSPKKIKTASQFYQISNSQDVSITLLNDIVLDKKFASKKFAGTIFGNNKQITIDYDIEDSLFENFAGTIKDVNFVFKSQSITLENNLGLLCDENNGYVENVNFSFDASITIDAETGPVYFCAIAVSNKGEIRDCNIDANISATNDKSVDGFTSFVAGHNYGKIINCAIGENSSIENLNVDASAVAIENHQGATINQCLNKSAITQSSNLTSWSPNVAGISVLNYGEINNCYNYGKLKSVQTVETINNCVVLVGGICANNYSTIFHCKNSGDVECSSINSIIYAGGIVGYANNYSNTVYTQVDYCISECNINASKTNQDTFAYCGGIAGYMIGNLSNSCSLATFTNGFDKENNVMASYLIGASYGQVIFGNINLILNLQNIHILSSSNITKSISIVYTTYGGSYVENLEADYTIYDTAEELKQGGAYWEG